MTKIDNRRHYILVVDTETANTITLEGGRLDMQNVLVYDCGWAVVDTRGNVYERRSYVNSDVFVYERELMHTAYYANKIPRYVEDLRAGTRIMANTQEIRAKMLEDMEHYNIHEVCAHNARFDFNALNSTMRYVSKSKYRYWFPFGTEIWDSLKMARSVMGEMPTYKAFCQDNGYVTKTGRIRFTAEICYRFISQDPEFIESHTGLEDVDIESRIVAYCYRQHKPMVKLLWEPRDFPEYTEFQRAFSRSMKDVPVLNMGA